MRSDRSKESLIFTQSVGNAMGWAARQPCTHISHAMAIRRLFHSQHLDAPLLPGTSKCTRSTDSKALAALAASSDMPVELAIIPSASID